MRLGVGDIARISYEAARLGLKSSLMPWARMDETARKVVIADTENRLNGRGGSESSPEGSIMAAVTQQLREFL